MSPIRNALHFPSDVHVLHLLCMQLPSPLGQLLLLTHSTAVDTDHSLA